MDYSKIRVKVGLIFSKIPVHQNFWTALVFVFAFLGFLAFVFKAPLLGLFLFLVSGFIDIVDGGVAAVRSGETAFGKWFSDFSNKGVECLFLLGLQFLIFPDFILPREIAMSLLFIFAFLFSYIKSNGYYRRILKREDERLPGFERAERLIPLYIGVVLYKFSPIYLSYTVILSILISTFRIVENLYNIMKIVKIKSK